MTSTSTVTEDPWSMPDYRARNALTLSVLQQRPFCAVCQPHVDQAVLAAQGASVDELREMTQ